MVLTNRSKIDDYFVTGLADQMDYRIRKSIVDMHAALNEVGVIYVSAAVHSGWSKEALVETEVDGQDE